MGMDMELIRHKKNNLAIQQDFVANFQEYNKHAEGALSDNTVRSVKADMKVYIAWCNEKGTKTLLPADPGVISSFLQDMAQVKKTATIRRYKASLAHIHKAGGQDDPTKSTVVQLAMKKITRKHGSRQDQAQALGLEELYRLTPQRPTKLTDKRDRALLHVAYDTMVRRSALVQLMAEDLKVNDTGDGTVLVRREKNDQEGQGDIRYISKNTMEYLQEYLLDAGIIDGFIFRRIGKSNNVGTNLSSDSVSKIFKKLAINAGIEPQKISGHSTRVGACQNMIGAGLDVGEVMQAGGWKTPTMVARYSEHLLASQGASAKLAKIQGRTK